MYQRINNRVLPHRNMRTAVPSFHRLLTRAWTIRNPAQELHHDQAWRFRHVGLLTTIIDRDIRTCSIVHLNAEPMGRSRVISRKVLGGILSSRGYSCRSLSAFSL